MSKFDPSKLVTRYRPMTTAFMPFDNRKYTLTHSDATGELTLTIGREFDAESVNPNLRDEVNAEWIPQLGQYVLCGKVYVGGHEYSENAAKIRYMIFEKEMETALEAIIFGDQAFFQYFPWLLDSPIYVHFESVYPAYNKMLFFGTPRQFLQKSKIANA
ncbi:staygreen family protein [Peribacillus kribbensis]|uniref:staygreen family protein n=1 Tax=Peribacillus kribbensis TaxID=356658 RepID=UPI0004055C4D|nr:staygreen family protein [Peribacillus kribbensis]